MNFHDILDWLKPFNDAGVINALGVIATFAAVLVALWPAISNWRNRPRLAVRPQRLIIENVPGDDKRQPKITTRLNLMVKNTGGSAAINVRALVTDLYIQTSEQPLSFKWRNHNQISLTSSETDLP